MELDTNGNITKLLGISSNSQESVIFQGTVGYNNGVFLLNDICANRYENINLGATARSLNIEDIESRMNSTGISARNLNRGFNNQGMQYGTTKKYLADTRYPALYRQEKYSGINVNDVADGTQVITGNIDQNAQRKMNSNGKMQSDKIYTSLPITSETFGPATNILTCAQTYYRFVNPPSSYFDNNNFYDMILRTGTYFWLATREISCYTTDSHASFGISYINGNILTEMACAFRSVAVNFMVTILLL